MNRNLNSKLFSALLVFCFFSFQSYAQGSFETVYNILQANCSSSSCHGGATPAANLGLDGSMSEVYDALINATPVNPNAANKGDKLVDPGHASRSFLLKKVAKDFSQDLTLEVADGGIMPPSAAAALSDAEKELIRQWIMYGAPETGYVVDADHEQLVRDYYEIGNGLPKIEPLPMPDPADGFQIHLGPIFHEPNQEDEYFLKQYLDLPDDIEVVRLELKMNDESHHFILRRYEDYDDAEGDADGLRLLETSFQDLSRNFVNAWQDDFQYSLPEGTAYFWEDSTVLDLNYHILNYNDSLTLPSEMYLNIYTQPKGTAEHEMKASLINNLALFIPNNNQPTTFTDDWNSGGNRPINIWMLSSHTHKYGTDFDIFLRNPDGSRGDQVYEGFYNFDYTFNQGFYDWEHPAVRMFDPYLSIDLQNGLIYEATYQNYGNNFVTFGFTTNDEMMLMYAQYIEGDLSTSIDDLLPETFEYAVAPNPFNDATQIFYTNPEKAAVKLEVFDQLGRKVVTLADETQIEGAYNYMIRKEDLGGTPGIYFVRLLVDGKLGTKKIIMN